MSVLLLVLLSGCGTATSGRIPARKWEGPWVATPTGSFKTTLYYGPWQCNQRWMDSCAGRCSSEGHRVMGCMWLADLKTDWQGSLGPLPAEAGGRLALTHCCCDYAKVDDLADRRTKWDRVRETFRGEWGKEFGSWPASSQGKLWPGHHIRDLAHGGDPTDPSNLLPVPPDIHELFNKAYPQCYAGGSAWSRIGPDLPYAD